ncbi:MAG TPA: 16S rRNA (cytosine(1402)-N(4))-methyltransferase RsmH [Acidobacteriota bacterium]|nr:16S rRNA (cytosine(1402)-N(4))-methyltransferase RsmH [Acidobacteriota bacterium]
MSRSIPLSLATLVPPGQGLRSRGELPRQADRLHTPVMRDEVLEHLSAAPGGTMVDATIGLGGHADAILEARDDVHLIGIDRDSDALELADIRLERWSGRYDLCRADHRSLAEMSKARGWAPVAAILIDLGASSLQLDTAERGFSFRLEGPLDMRMDRRQPRTAAEVVNRLSGDELRSLIRDYGEESHAARIARAIVKARAIEPITTTTRLAEIIDAAVPQRGPRRIHPATRTFQALRIAINDEFGGLQEFVIGASRLLAPGGRLIVLAFHSLEDRAIKRAFRYLASDCECPPELPQCLCDKRSEVKILTSRPLTPGEDEVASNRRARSAKMRVLERI